MLGFGRMKMEENGGNVGISGVGGNAREKEIKGEPRRREMALAQCSE